MVRSLRLLGVLAITLVTSHFAVAVEEKKSPHDLMLGKAAPEIAGDFAITGDAAVRLADLKGKVILLDFWAVWCEPCRACFPTLRGLNRKYKDLGLEIVGLTSYFDKFGFDAEVGAVKELDKKMTIEEEQTMLKEFAGHFKLSYRLQAATKADLRTVLENYKVEGIPQLVVIDRKGNVRLIKVGSGDTNAKAVEKMIKELLAEEQ